MRVLIKYVEPKAMKSVRKLVSKVKGKGTKASWNPKQGRSK
jgi:hypothetical protein